MRPQELSQPQRQRNSVRLYPFYPPVAGYTLMQSVGKLNVLIRIYVVGKGKQARDENPLIKSPAEDLPQDTQQEESSAKGEDS